MPLATLPLPRSTDLPSFAEMALEAAELRARLQQVRSPLSIRKAAELIDVDPTTWARWETGKNKPTNENVEAISREFNIDPSYITGSPEYVGPLARLEAKLDRVLELLGANPVEEFAQAFEQIPTADQTRAAATPPTPAPKRRAAQN